MSFLNFEEIKANNPIDTVASALGLQLNKSGATLRGKCPVCESSGDRNLAITVNQHPKLTPDRHPILTPRLVEIRA